MTGGDNTTENKTKQGKGWKELKEIKGFKERITL